MYRRNTHRHKIPNNHHKQEKKQCECTLSSQLTFLCLYLPNLKLRKKHLQLIRRHPTTTPQLQQLIQQNPRIQPRHHSNKPKHRRKIPRIRQNPHHQHPHMRRRQPNQLRHSTSIQKIKKTPSINRPKHRKQQHIPIKQHILTHRKRTRRLQNKPQQRPPNQKLRNPNKNPRTPPINRSQPLFPNTQKHLTLPHHVFTIFLRIRTQLHQQQTVQTSYPSMHFS